MSEEQREIFRQLRAKQPADFAQQRSSRYMLIGIAIMLLVAGIIFGGPWYFVIPIAAFMLFKSIADLFSIQASERIQHDLPQIRQAMIDTARESVQRLSTKFGANLVEDESGFPAFMTVRGGQAVEVGAAGQNLYIRSNLPVGGFRLFVYPMHQVHQSGFRNVVDIPIGDAQFDQRFLIQTNDTARAKTLLSFEQRNAISQLANELGTQPMSVTLNGGELKIFIPLPEPDSRGSTDLAFEVLESFQRQLGVWADKVEMDILAAPRKAEVANCLVCGEKVEDQRVKCCSCQTAHHQECWEYIGNCSVFGCGEKRYDKSF